MLYIVGTPIGNLDDLSYRQARTLTEAEIILSEDTRSLHPVFERIQEIFNLKPSDEQKRISYYKEKEFEKLPEVLEMLEEGKEVALVSESGMPLISDPGYLLVKTIIKKELPFTVIPGPTAATTALIYSGFNPQNHLFMGFFPKRTSEVEQTIKKLQDMKLIYPDIVFIFYESPNRINDTLTIIDRTWPEASISVSRELTKKFEETVRGKAKELSTRGYKGEICIVLT